MNCQPLAPTFPQPRVSGFKQPCSYANKGWREPQNSAVAYLAILFLVIHIFAILCRSHSAHSLGLESIWNWLISQHSRLCSMYKRSLNLADWVLSITDLPHALLSMPLSTIYKPGMVAESHIAILAFFFLYLFFLPSHESISKFKDSCGST